LDTIIVLVYLLTYLTGFGERNRGWRMETARGKGNGRGRKGRKGKKGRRRKVCVIGFRGIEAAGLFQLQSCARKL